MKTRATSRVLSSGAGLVLALAAATVGAAPAAAGSHDPAVTTPSDIQVDVRTGYVDVDWEPSTSEAGEIAAYWVKLDGRWWDWSEDSSITLDVERDRTYTLSIQAQDTAYNESDWSEPIEFTSSDEFPVTTPGNVQVSSSPGTVTVQWEPSESDAGVRDYVVSLRGAGSQQTPDTTATFSYPPGGDFEVTVKALDNASRWSDTSDPVGVTVAPSPDWELPSAPTDFRAADTATGVLFEWDEPAEGVGPFTYELFLGSDEINTIRDEVRLESPYFRECAPWQTPMELTITATSYGFTSPPSNPVSLCFG